MEIKFEEVNYIADKGTPFEKQIFENLNFVCRSNKITAFIGPNGCGKSVILELINSTKRPSSGIITIGDYTVLTNEIGYVSQNPIKNFFCNTVKAELEFALKNYNYKINEINKRISDSLKIVGLDDNYLLKSPFKLSLGEQKKLAFAIALSYNPKLILLDEPTLNLDDKSKQNLIKLIRIMKRRYKKTILISSNDTDFIHKIADNIFVINDGKIIKKGNKYEVFSDYDLLNKYDIHIPRLLEFSHLVKLKKNINIGYRDDINDLIKDIYRYVK